jgi:hypothetical protein
MRLNLTQHGERYQVRTIQGLTDCELFLDLSDGGAWPFLVGGVICLVDSDNERDLCLTIVASLAFGEMWSGVHTSFPLSCRGPNCQPGSPRGANPRVLALPRLWGGGERCFFVSLRVVYALLNPKRGIDDEILCFFTRFYESGGEEAGVGEVGTLPQRDGSLPPPSKEPKVESGRGGNELLYGAARVSGTRSVRMPEPTAGL